MVINSFMNGLLTTLIVYLFITLFYDKILSIKENSKLKWLKMIKTKDGYEYVQRVNKRDGVVIIAYKNETDGKLFSFILSKRPTFEKPILEFPAGLVDESDETPKNTAMRELAEETGYVGSIVKLYPKTTSSAGITNEMLSYVIVEILYKNDNFIKHDGEKIEILPLMSIEEIKKYIDEQGNNILISSRVLSFLFGNEFK